MHSISQRQITLLPKRSSSSSQLLLQRPLTSPSANINNSLQLFNQNLNSHTHHQIYLCTKSSSRGFLIYSITHCNTSNMFPPKPQPPNSTVVGVAPERVIVAVKADDKVISTTALSWALTHAVRPGDCVTLLALFSGAKSGGGRRFWGIPRRKGDCITSEASNLADRFGQISESCSQMLLQVQDKIQVQVRIKVISAGSADVVTSEAKSKAANWVILDKKLKRELKHCLDELHCNIVVMKGSTPKVLRLNLSIPDDLQTPFYSAAASPIRDNDKSLIDNMNHTTLVSSPDDPSTSYTRTSGENSMSSPDTGASVFAMYEKNPLYEVVLSKARRPPRRLDSLDQLADRKIICSATTESVICRNQKVSCNNRKCTTDDRGVVSRNSQNVLKNMLIKARTKPDLVQYKEDVMVGALKYNEHGDGGYALNSTIREAVSLTKTSSIPPPLCSLCQCKAPAFGKPPQKFYYEELEEATDGFSYANFIAEGGFGAVHRGALRNGLIIVVKQLKFVGSQTDADFCREVRLLSCAQHRNVVLLIGFCIEEKKRLLVYEYICNSSLDFHLHGNEKAVLNWETRLRIAIGTARGLRYLHEDCRVGCLEHRKLWPRNILLTHDFEPLVADFGLARLHGEWEFSDQIIATPGYLAPEYFNDGKLTEKVDIYAFGLVLLELITGRRAHDLRYRTEHQLLLDNIHALAEVEPIHILAYKHQLLDSHLASYQEDSLPYELHVIGRAASLCLQRDPDLRPPMSKVVKLLESGGPVTPLALDLASVGCRSGYMQGLNTNTVLESKRRHSRRLSY